VSAALFVIIAWFTGYTVRQRRRYALRLQDEAASKAVAQERLRIARELHDVVAHSMSVIAVQAGYGQYVIDTQPADARNALGAIQATSREARSEEHTSELQSRGHLVCRLLLEEKKRETSIGR